MREKRRRERDALDGSGQRSPVGLDDIVIRNFERQKVLIEIIDNRGGVYR